MEASQLQMVLEGHHHEVTSCSFSFDGRIIVSSSLDTRALLWDAETGEFTYLAARGRQGFWVLSTVFIGLRGHGQSTYR